MATSRVQANGIEIAYETFGDPAHPPMVLVMGLGTQMLGWPDGLCRQLADRGFHVVRFDNRDIGESSYLSGVAAPSAIAVRLRRRRPSYTLDDLAADTAGLVDALGLGPVHLVGASMGGFIAQLVALRRPDLVRSLSLFMTSTGARRVGRATPRVLATVLRRKPAVDRDSAVAASLSMFRLIGSPAYPPDETQLRTMAGMSYDRGYNPTGQRRQLGAVVAQVDRTEELAAVGVPTVVMHGLDDPLVAYSGGIALARAIPGARFVGFAGMGHDLPEQLWPVFTDEIAGLARRAG